MEIQDHEANGEFGERHHSKETGFHLDWCKPLFCGIRLENGWVFRATIKPAQQVRLQVVPATFG
jgi:hypothetical protein